MSCEEAGDRDVTPSQAFPDNLDVRYYVLLLPRMHSSCPAQAAHDFIEDDQRSIPVANGFDGLEISRYRWHTSERLGSQTYISKCSGMEGEAETDGTNDRLGHKGAH